jgi:hypothetical protein
VEAILASAHELHELDVLHGLASASITFEEAERREVERLFTAEPDPLARLGFDGPATLARAIAATLAGIERWRRRAASPLADPATARACETVARSYEQLYAEVGRGR